MCKGRVCSICKSKILIASHTICPKCGNYLRVYAKERIITLADLGTFREWNDTIRNSNHINNRAYIDKLEEVSCKCDLDDAIVIGEMDIYGQHVAIGVMDTRFMMASMGYVVGEKVTLLFEKATKKNIPVVLFCCSGGARMQEGIVSLMQMGKTAIAVEKHNKKGLLYISVLTDPTMGGVTASFATLADIILAEKNAKIGFTGERVIEQNIGIKMPKEFQTAEFKLEQGFIDEVVSRDTLKNKLSTLINFHKKNQKLQIKRDVRNVSIGFDKIKLEPWEKVRVVRSSDRPTSKDYIEILFESFVELKGDRVSGDDHAIISGIASFHGMAVTVIGQEKGKKTVEESVYRNWGMPMPCGYRKALRLMKQAEKFNRPIICFVDTIGAACGKEAEKAGQASAISNMLKEISNISVPILSIIIGEACSGGALALCMGNEVWMLENSVYSILSPEGYASILWRDGKKVKEATYELKMEAYDLYEMHIIDKIIKETVIVNRDNMGIVCEKLDVEILRFLLKYNRKNRKVIVKERQKRFRAY